MLKENYHSELKLNEAKSLAIKILKQTMDTAMISEDRVEICEVSDNNGKIEVKQLPSYEISILIQNNI